MVIGVPHLRLPQHHRFTPILSKGRSSFLLPPMGDSSSWDPCSGACPNTRQPRACRCSLAISRHLFVQDGAAACGEALSASFLPLHCTLAEASLSELQQREKTQGARLPATPTQRRVCSESSCFHSEQRPRRAVSRGQGSPVELMARNSRAGRHLEQHGSPGNTQENKRRPKQ